METVSAFKCAYCTKIYLSKDSCRRHERKCFWREETRSCATCIFERYKDYRIMQGHSTSIRTCLRNHEITGKLRTACPDHHFKKAKCNINQMKEIRANYYPDPIITQILEKHKAEIERRMEAQRVINEKGYALKADAILGHLANAIGWTMMVKGTAQLSNQNEGLVEDDFLEKNFETRMDEVDIIIFIFESIGINGDRIKEIINAMSGQLLNNSLFYLPLIQQGNREYHQKMVAYSELMEDADNADFHRSKLESLGDWTVAGIAGNLIFPGMSMFKENEPDLDAMSSFLKKLHEIDPDIKDDMIESMRNPNVVVELWDSPF